MGAPPPRSRPARAPPPPGTRAPLAVHRSPVDPRIDRADAPLGTRLEHPPGGGRSVQAFAPGRVNLIGEHTDYNDGSCLPFAIERGVTVAPSRARRRRDRGARADLAESDRFELVAAPGRRSGWRGVRARRGRRAADGRDRAAGPAGSRSGRPAARRRAVLLGGADGRACLALCAVGAGRAARAGRAGAPLLAIENDWCGAQTGLLDQLASLCARARSRALRIDMRGPKPRPCRSTSDGHVLATLDSGRRAQPWPARATTSAARSAGAACELLGVESLRDAADARRGLPDPLDRRVRHVITENERVDAAVAALEAGDLAELGRLLDASHASLRDDYEVSVPEVERAVERLQGGGRARRPHHGRRLRRLGARAVPARRASAGARGQGRAGASRAASLTYLLSSSGARAGARRCPSASRRSSATRPPRRSGRLSPRGTATARRR